MLVPKVNQKYRFLDRQNTIIREHLEQLKIILLISMDLKVGFINGKQIKCKKVLS